VELRGVVRPDRPLLVVALQEEADALDDELPILVSGPGKVHAAAAVTAALASVRPASVINIGTAGGLRDGLHGVHDVGTVIQHDFDSRAIRALVNRDYGMPIELDSGGTGLVLATGDRFIADTDMRNALARSAHLVDMEGYAVAWAAGVAGVPVRLIKLVSDDAGETAARTWAETVGEHSRTLARWVHEELLR
jgi:adenosylhomocysteine nucleosidase